MNATDRGIQLPPPATTAIKAGTSHLLSPALKDMRSPGELPVDIAGGDIQANTTIPSNAILKVTVTSANQPKRQKKTFRVIERPDGVLVEHPRYQKIYPTHNPERHFQKELVTLPVPSKLLKPTVAARAPKSKGELLGIGAFAHHTSKTRDEGLPTSGRGGYNMMADDTKELKSESCVADTYSGVAPMERFLTEVGFWNPISRRSG